MQNRVITSHSDGVIRVRDWNTLAVLELYQGHSDVVSALCLDTAFSLYSTGFDGTIKKWNMATRKVAFSYENRGNSVNALAASEGILLVGLRGGGIISYNIHDASALDTISFNTKPVSSLLSLNGSFYGAGLDGLLVKFREFSQTNTYIVYNSETESLRSLEFDGRNLIVLLGESNAVFFSNDQIVKTAELQTSLVCIAATNDFLLGGSRSGAVFSWNIETFELEFELKDHVAQVNFILVVGQRLFSASDDKTIIEWSLDDRVTVNTYQRLSANALGHLGPINSLSYSYGTLFSAGADLSVRRWNIQTGRHEDVYFGFSKAVTTVLFHNGSVFAGSEDFAVLMFRPSFNDLSQASTSSRTIISKSEIRRRRIVQRSQSIGSSNSSLLSIIIGLVVSIIFAASFIFLFVYWKSGTRKQVPDISTSFGVDSNTTVTDLRTIVNSVMGISKHAAFLVENSAFAKVKKIATGGGGELFLAKVMDPGLRKKLPENVIQKVLFGKNNKISEEAFYQEVGIMILLSSFPNFCQIVGYTENPLSMILKHYTHGSLDDWLGKNNYGTKIILKILKETALALSIMHSHYLAHCDLKPQNILVEVHNGLPSCYLTDFGITQILSEKIIATKAFHVINLRGLSTHYAAPEALRSFRTKNYTLIDFKAYDIYSFGCSAYEVLTKNMPWA
jgi:WD40 repeat protein